MRPSPLATAVAVAVFSLAACGSDADSSSDAPAEASEGFCALAEQFYGSSTGVFETGDPDNRATEWATAVERVRAFTEEAPAEIRPDAEVLLDVIERLGAVYAKYDWDPEAMAAAAATDPEIEALSDTSESDAAGARVDEYVERACGIDTEP